ncbi:MAG: SRPBCC family protein [Actinomycetota bacterium]|nr:SRPBCC family protein [Actinomycetota bacterium]
MVPGSLEDSWHSFNQLEDIAPCFPGAVLTSVTGDRFTGTVKVKLGPIAMMYTGTGEFLERNENSHTVVISAAGKDKRGNGTAGATVTAVLTRDGDGTAVDVTTDMNVTGKPAQFGRGVIQDISDKLLAQFVQCVIRKVSGGEEAAETPEPAAVTTAEPPVTAADTMEPAGPAATRPPAAAGSTVPRPPAGESPSPRSAPAAELDLGSTLWPVLVRRFGPAALGLAAVLALVVWLARRRR